MTETNSAEMNKGLIERLLSDMNDKDSELEINLRNFRVSLPNTLLSLELSGLLTVNVHVRDLTATEKDALAARRVAVPQIGQ
jgi:hypothetical protein